MARRTLWLGLAALSLSGCAKHYVYQNTAFGMNEKALKTARPGLEALPTAEGDRLWLERAVIDSLKASVTYRMGPAGLRGVAVVFEPAPMSQEQYVDHYHQVRALLSEKYGTPEVAGADLAVRAQKVRIVEAPDWQNQCLFRTPFVQIVLTCEGRCDGSTKQDSITISYEKPRLRTEGL